LITTASEDAQCAATFPFWKRSSSFQIFLKLRRNSSPPGSTRSASYSLVSCGTKPVSVPHFCTLANFSALLIFERGFPTRTTAREPPRWLSSSEIVALSINHGHLIAKSFGLKLCAG
jgi:hypothetical protein